MRAVPLGIAILVGLGCGIGGWLLGRASVEPVVHVTESGARAEPAPTPRPMLEPGRGGGSRSGSSPSTASRPTEPAGSPPGPARGPEDATRGPSPAETRSIPRGLIGPEGFLPLVPGGVPAVEAPPEPAAVAEARQTMLSNPEEATAKIEALLESRDARERAGAYRLLGEARHPNHQALVQRAQREAKNDDEIKALLGALARFKGPSWNAVQITGAPDTPVAGDLVTAWASKGPDMGEVWIDLEYAEAVTPEAVRVHETYNPGAVARVQAQRPDGSWALLWEGTATPGSAPWWFEPRLESVRFSTTKIRLIVDTSRVEGWNEIDAVELLGDGRRQWALKAQAGSNYTE